MPTGDQISIQDLQRQLMIMNKQNQDLIKLLNQQQSKASIDESLSRRSSIASFEDYQSQLSFTTIEDFQPQSPCASFQPSSIKESEDQLSQNQPSIAKPHGSLAKNVRTALNLTKEQYQGYRGDLRDLVNGMLDLDKKWCEQDTRIILSLIDLFKQKNPTFPKCNNDWAIKEIMRAIINNKREYQRNKNYKSQEKDNEMQSTMNITKKSTRQVQTTINTNEHSNKKSKSSSLQDDNPGVSESDVPGNVENMCNGIEVPRGCMKESDCNFWMSEEPEHLMNAYLALYPEAQYELIDLLVDQRMTHSEVPGVKGKESVGSVKNKKRTKKSDSRDDDYNNNKRKVNDTSNSFGRKSRRLATMEVINYDENKKNRQ